MRTYQHYLRVEFPDFSGLKRILREARSEYLTYFKKLGYGVYDAWFTERSLNVGYEIELTDGEDMARHIQSGLDIINVTFDAINHKLVDLSGGKDFSYKLLGLNIVICNKGQKSATMALETSFTTTRRGLHQDTMTGELKNGVTIIYTAAGQERLLPVVLGGTLAGAEMQKRVCEVLGSDKGWTEGPYKKGQILVR